MPRWIAPTCAAAGLALLTLALAPAAAPATTAAPTTAAAPPATAAANQASSSSAAATPAPAATPSPAAPPPLPPPPTAAEAARLAAGEVLLSSRTTAVRSLAEEIGRGVVDAAPARVFAAVTDFAHYDEWVPFVKRSDAQPQADGSVFTFQSLDLPFPMGKRYYRLRAESAVEGGGERQVWRTWWTYLPGTGNVADHHGFWVLTPFGTHQTLGTCLLFTDPGGSTPAWALHRGTAETMPYIFSALRQQIHRSRYDHP